MNYKIKQTLIATLLCTSFSALAGGIHTQTNDGVTIYGDKAFAGLDSKAPLILLFHQGGSNARGEYSDLIPWLNKAGFRVMAWDQRSGGGRYGSDNRTIAKLPDGKSRGYCEAYPDLQAALDYTVKNKLADKVTVWGSSYSAALVVQLAAKNPEKVSGVLSFSPASGGPMAPCRARNWLDKVKAPMLFMRPQSEMERQPSKDQRDILTGAGASFKVIKHGVHGSSMLVDSRTKQDMSKARSYVLKWLKKL